MVSFHKLLLLSSLCFVLFANAQADLAFKIDSILEIKDTKLKIEGFEKIRQQQDTLVKTESLGTLYHELGFFYYKEKTYDKALLFLNKAVLVRSKFNDTLKYNHSRFIVSRAYAKAGKFKKEHTILLEVINDLGADIYTSYAHRFLGRNERNKGDFAQSLHYLNLGLANKELSNNLEFDSNLRFGIISTYAKKYESTFNINDANSDLKIIQKHEASILVDSLRTGNRPVLHNNLAVIYHAFNDLGKALYYYEKALNHYAIYKNEYKELEVVNNIAMIYSKQKKHALAKASYEKVLAASDDEEQIANAYNGMGYYKNTAISKEKIPYLEKAVFVILEREEDTFQEFYLPTLAEIDTSGYQQEVLIYLIDLAGHYVEAYKQEKDRLYLVKAKKTVTLIDQLVSLIRYQTNTEASKLFWIEKGVNTYMLAVEICYLLEDTTTAFYFMEKNKALVLQENIKTLQTKLTFDIPSKDLEREYKLHYDLLRLQAQSQQNVENESWKETYSLKNKEYQIFMDSMQRMYPEYTKTKQEVAIISLDSVVTAFKAEKTAFVEYILHETDGYGIYYDINKPIFFKISDISKFHEQLNIMRTFMIKRTMNPVEMEEYQKNGYDIFQQLFPFENAAERLQDKKITIISDEALQYIPFEILPTQPNGELIDAYIVNTTETSYLQSFSLFQQIKQKRNTPTQKLLAIAPYEFKNSALSTLTGTEKVLEFLSKYDAAVLLTKNEASKENFLNYRNDFEIIHLNTHAGLDSITKTPWIAFNEEKMSLTELFGLENQADLVILDACKTNDGVNISGEGLINLSRGFFYNGTQSVLASQWNVNEQAGNEILQEFYKEIEKGTSKSKALQLAKKAYLQQHDRTQNTPYYWAAFTLTGSTNSLTLQPVQNYTYIFIGIAILVFLVLLFYYRKNISA